MNRFTFFLSACTEAWQELRINRVRVIVSLVAVCLAVAAMTTVIALGELFVQGERAMMERVSGRPGVIRVTASPENSYNDPSCQPPWCSTTYSGMQDPQSAHSSLLPVNSDGVARNPFAEASRKVVDGFSVKYWSREVHIPSFELKEFTDVRMRSIFHGRSVEPQEYYISPVLKGVDPMYGVIHRKALMQGRWLTSADSVDMVMPVVIDENLWRVFGKPALASSDGPLLLRSSSVLGGSLRVVGVIESDSAWSEPVVYATYDALTQAANPAALGSAEHTLALWAAPSDANAQNIKMTKQAMKAALGEEWNVFASTNEGSDDTMLKLITTFTLAVGSFIIFLGALGLINVSVVTVRQRIRDIGVRRAVGASAKRIFFSVMMESVVATLLAGCAGVLVAVIVINVLPFDQWQMPIPVHGGFPVRAAALGVIVSTIVGAISGLIPALTAVKVRTIEAIRY